MAYFQWVGRRSFAPDDIGDYHTKTHYITKSCLRWYAVPAWYETSPDHEWKGPFDSAKEALAFAIQEEKED